MKMSTRQIVMAGLLSALTVTLGATGWGFIPIPTPAGAATVMHIPVILAGVLEGPLVGAFVGLLFSLFTVQFAPPWVVIPFRLLIGPVSYFVYRFARWSVDRLKLQLRWGSPVVAAGVAGLVGSAVNTCTLILAVAFGIFDAAAAWGIVLANGIAEAILAAVLVGALITPLLPSKERSAKIK